MFRWNVGETFVRNTGYNEVGELNNIIIIYPQVTNITVNPMGCWDYWGYTVSFCSKHYDLQILNYCASEQLNQVLKLASSDDL